MLKRVLIAATLVACSAQSGADSRFEEGVHYDTIAPAVTAGSADEIEVVEIFSYACVHCATFDPFIHAWAEEKPEGVRFTRIPAVFNRSWEPFARAYYTAEVLGVLEETHEDLFQALHTQRKPIRSIRDLAAFYKDYGVDEDEFLKTAQSFAVETKLRRSQKLVPRFGVAATPTLVINGKYRTTGGQAGGYEEMIELVNDLVAQEQAQVATAQTTDDDGEASQPES